MIVNKKNIDPRSPDSFPVFQLETAMGSAISVFKNSSAICVPRTRFAPVKTSEDLLAVRSDNFILTDEFDVIPNPQRKGSSITITLDPDYYKLVDEMAARFPYGAPSLVGCNSLKINGDVKFGKDIKIIGEVEITNKEPDQLIIDHGSVING